MEVLVRKRVGLFVAAFLPLLAGIPAYATGSYSVAMDGNTLRSGPAPVSVDTSYSFISGTGSWAYGATLDARPGGVSAVTSADVVAFGGYMVGGSLNGRSSSSTNDFVITGPPGATYVTGTFYFWLHGVVELAGGDPGNGGHQGGIQFELGAANLGWLGQWISSNHWTIGGAGLAGYPGPSVGTVIGLTGSFPVGSGFPVSLGVSTWNYPYGKDTSSPMHIRCNASESPMGSTTLGIGNLTGLVMDLPTGYTVSSPEWNVVDNHFLAPVLAVSHGAAPPRLALSIASGNPSPGATTLRFALPADANVSLGIYDVAGRQVRDLAHGWRAAGVQSVAWDGRDDSGAVVAPGVYMAAVRAGSGSATARLVRVR